MSTETGVLTENDLEFLRRPLHGFLTVAGGPQPPQPRPVWFEATVQGTIRMFSAPDSIKVRRLRKDPRASIVVATPVGERERWIAVAGRVTMETDDTNTLNARLFARYWDLDGTDRDRTAELAAMMAEKWVTLVMHPETVHRFTN